MSSDVSGTRRGLQIPLVTIALVAVVGIGFAVGVTSGMVPVAPTPQQLVTAGASYGPRTFDGEWWRILSAAVLHAGWAHLIVNVMTMSVVGAALERRVGGAATLVVFVGASAIGTTAGTDSAPYAVIAGASSGALGMAAALLVVMAASTVKRGPKTTEIVLLGVALSVIVAHIAMGRGRDDIDQIGHLAGVVAGLAMGIIVVRPVTAETATTPTADTAFAAIGAAGALAIMLLADGPTPYEPRLATKRLVAIEERFDQIVDGPRPQIADALEREVVAPLLELVNDRRLDDRRMNEKLRVRVTRLKTYAGARAKVVTQFADAVRRDDVAALAEIEQASREADAILDGALP